MYTQHNRSLNLSLTLSHRPCLYTRTQAHTHSHTHTHSHVYNREAFLRSDFDMQQYLYQADRTYREMHIVTQWLQDTFKEDYFAESSDKSLDGTQQRLTLFSERCVLGA